MVAQAGQGCIVSFKDSGGSFQAVAGMRTRDITINGAAVDVTNADSTGNWREILDGAGVKNASINGDGVFKDDTGIEAIRDSVFAGTVREAKIFIPAFGTFDGLFKCTQLKSGGTYNGEVTYSITLESAGALAFTGI